MRKVLAVGALLAATVPVSPAGATHELLPVCVAVGAPAAPACDLLVYQNYVHTICSAVASPPTPDGRVVVFTASVAHFPQAAELTGICYWGDAVVVTTTPGPAGVVGPAVRVAGSVHGNACTRWLVTFVPGNTFGLDPDTVYSTADYCTS